MKNVINEKHKHNKKTLKFKINKNISIPHEIIISEIINLQMYDIVC